jgi:hypothetical protein
MREGMKISEKLATWNKIIHVYHTWVIFTYNYSKNREKRDRTSSKSTKMVNTTLLQQWRHQELQEKQPLYQGGVATECKRDKSYTH